MGLLVIAEQQSDYDACAEQQRRPAAAPSDPNVQRGRDVFVSSTCAMCHTIQGTAAQAQHAPDLTHVASRQMLAAGTLKNTAENRAAWIADPQRFKPGSNMPPSPLSADDAGALL